MKWNIDPSHSSLEFAVRHMGLSTVRGRFKKVSGTIEAEDGKLKGLEATVDAASIDTAEVQRDEHLRSPDFLDIANYPTITFRSTNVQSRGNSRYVITGNLTVRDQARPVSFEVETTEPMTDPWGSWRAGGAAAGKLNRKDWGLTWNKALELGALLVGEEVRFNIEVEAIAPVAVAA